jgi:Bacterial toxin 37
MATLDWPTGERWVYVETHSRFRQNDATEIRLGFQVLLLARPGRAWPVELACHRVDARRIGVVLHAFRQHNLEISRLREFWHHYHLGGERLDDEGLLQAFATAVTQLRIEALLLPRMRAGVAGVSTAVGAGGMGLRPPWDQAVVPAPAEKSFAQWDLRDRLSYVLNKATKKDVPSNIVAVFRGLLTPEGLAWFALFVGLEGASMAAGGVGLAADAVLVGLLWGMFGMSAVYGVIAFGDFLRHTVSARSTSDLDVAAEDLARAAVLFGAAALTFFGGWAKGKSVAGRVGGTAGTSSDGAAASGDTARTGPRRAATRQSVPSEQSGTSSDPQNAEVPRSNQPPALPASPDQSPGPGWEWRGKGPVGSDRGSWFNPTSGESLHPDLNHSPPIGPHWDYTDGSGTEARIFPDGRMEPK